MNIPVRLDGELFDLDTLVHLSQDKEGYRTNPQNGEKFLLSGLQPARDVQKRLDKIIETAKELQDDGPRLRT